MISVAECPKCGLAFQTPQPSSEQSAEYFTWRYQTSKSDGSEADRYLSNREFTLGISRARAQWLREQSKGGRLLDIGAGNGALIFAAREGDCDAHGIDQSDAAIEKAKRMFDVDVTKATIHDLPDDDMYDIITLYDTVEHLRDPQATLQAASRHLVPDGLVCVETMNYDCVQRLLRGDKWHFYLFDHLFYFSPHTLGALLKQCGYEEPRVHAVPASASHTTRENYHKGSGVVAKYLRKLSHVASHPIRTMRYPFTLMRARSMWPAHWNSELLLMSAKKPNAVD
jgi:2-polyprenyl-3-methyl-5-hydroxy-6-metoxy-1,4-benzoquinol methylase